MRKMLTASLAIWFVALAGCALPQPSVLPTAPAALAAHPVAIPAGPGGLSVAAVPCPSSSPYLFCVGVLP